MDNLNDDCLLSIFKHVPELHDQVQIARSCHRFDAIIQRIWLQQQRYKTFNLEEWRGWLPNINDLAYFFNIAKATLLSIVVGDETLAQFLHEIQHLLKLTKNEINDEDYVYCLENVQNLVDEEKSLDIPIADNEMDLLVQMVPNLLSLHIKESLSGRHVCNFHKLEELSLYVASEKRYEIDNTSFEEICKRLKNLRILDVRNYDGLSQLDLKSVLQCHNLAVLKVNLNPLKKYLQEVLRLPKLVCLHVMLDFDIDISSIQNFDTHDYKIYETTEFYEILKAQSERIIGLSIDLYYFPLPVEWQLHLKLWQSGKKYKKFSLCNCEFSADPLIDYANVMKSLETLCCRHWQHLTNDHVLHFVKYCSQLQHLDVSYCSNIEGNLLYQMLDILKKQDRQQPLYVYYLLSGLESEVKKLMLKFLDLNDDCLFSVYTYLELDDLLSIKNVSRRLDMTIKLFWRHQFRNIAINSKQMQAFKTSKQDFIDLMSSACEILEKLTMKDIESSQLKWISHIQFPKLNSLECSISHDNNKSKEDDIIVLTKLCPSITQLALTSSTTGKYIKNMKLLNDLDLSCCEDLRTKHLAEIFKTLKLRKFALFYFGYNRVLGDGLSAIIDCVTLEELKIDDHHLLLFIDKLLCLTHLRKITCYTRDYDVFLLEKLTRMHGTRMHTLIFNCVLWSNDALIANIRLMKHLKRFVLVDDDIEDEQLEILSNDLKHLQEFHVKRSRLESDNGILEIVRHCESLQVLNVTKSNISEDFLNVLMDILSTLKRDGPLKLYCGGTAIEHNICIEMLQFLDLNDDCLLRIYTFLELDDLLSIKNVCRHLDMTVKLFWRYHYRNITINSKQMQAFKTNKKDFVDLLTSACGVLETLTIKNIESAQLKWISHIQFPKLNSLGCGFSYDNNGSEEDIISISKLCPFITRLALNSSTTGKYIKNMKFLNDLDLRGCEKLRTKHLVEIFKTLKLRKFYLFDFNESGGGLRAISNCVTLEELGMQEHHLLEIKDELLYMTHLRKIICFLACDDGARLPTELTRLYGPRIHTFICNSAVLLSTFLHDWENFHLMTNLKRFAWIRTDSGIASYINNLKHLPEFHGNNRESDDGIMEVVRQCKSLEILNVTKSNISEGFLQSLMDVLNGMDRGCPLKLYCGGTAIENEIFIKALFTLSWICYAIATKPYGSLRIFCAELESVNKNVPP